MPPKKKDLYMATSINDLKDKLATKGGYRLERPTDQLLKAADQIYQQSLTEIQNGDEEKAFVLTLRFADIFSAIGTSLKKKKEWKTYYGKFKESVTLAEKLEKSLEERYQILENSQNVTNDHVDNEVADLVTGHTELLPLTTTLAATKLEDNESMTCNTLHVLLEANEPLIIMDVRSASDFMESKMKSTSCINVSSDILRPGSTAVFIEKLLNPEQRSKWKKRFTYDFVILMDWNSSSNSIARHSPIETLRDAISKWDEEKLKNPPYILEGGYEEWLLHYPAETTNSKFQHKSSSLHSTNLSVTSLKNVDYNMDDLLNEAFVEPTLNGSSQLADSFSDLEYIDSDGAEVTTPGSFPSVPSVDRSSKPKVLGEQNSRVRSKPSNPRPAWISPSEEEKSLDSVLESQERVADKELQNSEELLKKEKEFELLCYRINSDSNEVILSDLKASLEAVQARLKELEEEKDAFEKENQQLKEKIKDGFSSEDQLVQKRIKKSQIEKHQLDAQVAKLREERKKKEAEQNAAKALTNTELSPVSTTRKLDSLSRDISTNMQPTVPVKPQKKISPSNTTELRPKGEKTEPLKSEPREPVKRGLSRSHSSPNINELVEAESAAVKFEPLVDRNSKPRIPPFERALKPSDTSAARQRNLNPVYSSHGKGKAGLKNLGNTCFMNSIIQCLHSTRPLSSYLINGDYKKDINVYNKDGTKGRIIEELSVIIDTISRENYRFISPTDFKNTVSRYLPICVGNDQQDAHEFLTCLMEKLHGDINSAAGNQKPKLPDIERSVNSLRATQIFWDWHTSHNRSKLVDLFEGVLQSKLTCLSCRTESNNYEVFSCLSVPIPNQSRCELKDCIESFLKEEKMCGEAAWDCPNCKQKREAEKRMVICKLPSILIIHLKRFYYKGLWRQKLQTFVDFPVQLDMKPFLLHREPNQKYQAYGVVNHYGTMEGGHYTAYCRNPPSEQWLKCDDQDISDMSSGAVKTSAAYILFYSNL